MSEFNMEKIKGIEHLSKMYNAEQIRYVLGMSKSNVYRFLEEVYKTLEKVGFGCGVGVGHDFTSLIQVAGSLSGSPCARYASCRSGNTCSSQACRDRSSCSSWYCNCAACTPRMPA